MRGRWIRGAAAVVGTAVLIGLTAVLARPWPIVEEGERSAVVACLSAASGLTVEAAGPMVLRLLPRPQIRIAGLALSGLGGAVSVDADRFTGQLGLSSLLRGELRVVSTILKRPTIVIDLDRVLPLAQAMARAGGEASGPSDPLARFRFLQTQGLTIDAGLIRFVSADARRDMLFSEVSTTASWADDTAAAGIDGTASWRGVRLAFDAMVSGPADLPRGDGALTSLRLQSSLLDLNFNGTLAYAGTFRGSGRLSAATHDLPGFLRTIGTPALQLAAFQAASISGDATITGDTLSLSEVDLGLDSMAFQGALAVHARAGRPGLAGTLDTDRIDLDPFLRALPALRGPDGGWTRAPLLTATVAADDIDLRISASHASVAGLRFEDGSLSLQSGDGRMELSLGEAHAYDGLLKGRILATSEEEETDLRADLSLSRLDLRKLMKDLTPARTLAGTLTGHISLDGHGRSPAAIVANLDGRGQMSVRDGAVGVPLANWLRAVAPLPGAPAPAAWPARVQAFESASAGFEVTAGSLALTDAWVLWPDARAVVRGAASIPRQDLDLDATVRPIDEAPDMPLVPASVVTATGPWSNPAITRVEPPAPAGGER